MQNQVFDTKGLLGREAQSRRSRNIVVLSLMALVAVVSIGIVISIGNNAVEVPQTEVSTSGASSVALPSVPQTTFSTQQYWDLAAEHARLNAPVGSAPATFSTQQYWDLAAEHEANQAPAVQPEPAYFTEQYWNMAAESEPDAYYTEKYWKMSK